MLKGTINGVAFTLEAGKADTADQSVKRLLESMAGEVFNPITGQTYRAKAANGDLDAYLLLSKLAGETRLDITVTGYSLEEAVDEPGKTY